MQPTDSFTDNFQQQVIDAFVKGFKKRDGLNKKQKALGMLACHFQKFGFDLPAFFKHCALNAKQIDRFVSYVYYGIYYFEISPDKYRKEPHTLEFLLFCLLAETIDEKKLCQILADLTHKKRLQLIYYCSSNLREGAWAILEAFEILCENVQDWKIFLSGVKNKYYDSAIVQTFTDALAEGDSSNLQSLLELLDRKAAHTVDEISRHLPALIDRIVHSPIEGFTLLEKQKRAISPLAASPEQTKKIKKSAEEAKEKLEQLFGLYRQQHYTPSEMQEFFRQFGLRGFFFNSAAVKNPQEPLLEMLHDISNFVCIPNALTGDYIQSVVSFVLSLCQQLYAFHRRPLSYSEGLDHIVYTVATRGRSFTQLRWLPSVLNGLETLRRHLMKKNASPFSLADYPLVIFDQAPPEDLKKNHVFIQKLAKKFQACIWHLSLEQTLKFAKKLGLAQWLPTTDEGNFGYAGSRNCTLLLAPVIYRASRQGKKTVNDLLEMSDQELTLLFDQAVLGKEGSDLLVHTGEDDAAMPVCNFFSDSLFAHNYPHVYLQRPIYCIGRQTYDLKYHLDAETLLKHPSLVFKSTRWNDMPMPGGMKGLLTKPKFCLPLPFGNEECHVMAAKTYYDPFHQPLLHLAGPRFPKKLYPTSPFDGLVECLDKLLPYTLQTIMTEDLIDHIRVDIHHGIFPWNDKKLKLARPFKSLEDLWCFANDPETIEEIKKRFWDNFLHTFETTPPKGYILASGLHPLTHLPSALAAFPALLEFYTKTRQDTLLLLDYAKEVIENHRKGEIALDYIRKKTEKRHRLKIRQTKLTKGLQLILQWINSLKREPIRLPEYKDKNE